MSKDQMISNLDQSFSKEKISDKEMIEVLKREIVSLHREIDSLKDEISRSRFPDIIGL